MPAPTSAPTAPQAPNALVGARRAVDQRILQVNTAELRSIQQLLGQVEREKLERHVEALFELEQRITAEPIPTGGLHATDSRRRQLRESRHLRLQ